MSTRVYDRHGVPIGRRLIADQEFSPRCARDALAQGCLLIDCRTPDEYHLVSIDNSLLIPLDELIQRLDELEAHRDRTILVLCHSGRRSLRAVQILKFFGFDSARSVCGGIDAWATCIQTDLPRYRTQCDGTLALINP